MIWFDDILSRSDGRNLRINGWLCHATHEFSNFPSIRMSMPGEDDRGAFDAMGSMPGCSFKKILWKC